MPREGPLSHFKSQEIPRTSGKLIKRRYEGQDFDFLLLTCMGEFTSGSIVPSLTLEKFINNIIIPQKSFSYINLLWINELFITFPGKMNY